MKLKLICSLVLLFALVQSCKKAVELKNQLVDAYWQNIEGVVLQFDSKEAYVIDAGSSDLESNPQVLDILSTPYIKNIIQTSPNSYTGEIIKTVSSNGKITSFSYENTTINFSEQNGNLVINISNSDPAAATWTANADNGSNPSTPVVRDTTTSFYKDAGSTFTVASTGGGSSSFSNIPVYGRYRPVGYAPDKYYYRMDAYVNPNSPWLLTLYFAEKPSANKTYKVVEGSGLYQMGADNVGIIWNSYMKPESGYTATVTVSGGKITVTGTDINTSSTTSVYDDKISFKIISQ